MNRLLTHVHLPAVPLPHVKTPICVGPWELDVRFVRYACEHVTVVGCGADLASSLTGSSFMELAAKVLMLFGCGAIYLAHYEERHSAHAKAHAYLREHHHAHIGR